MNSEVSVRITNSLFAAGLIDKDSRQSVAEIIDADIHYEATIISHLKAIGAFRLADA